MKKKLSDKKSKWDIQVRKGSLELVVLAILFKRKLYGLEILQTLRKEADFYIPEGTLYPLLDRMKREGLLEAKWVHSDEIRPRKYYSLTREGEAHMKIQAQSWHEFTADMERILGPLKKKGGF